SWTFAWLSRRAASTIVRATVAMLSGSVPLRTGSSATNHSRYGRWKNPSTAPPTLSRSQAPGAARRSRTSAGVAVMRRSASATSPASIAAAASRKRASSVASSRVVICPCHFRPTILPKKRLHIGENGLGSAEDLLLGQCQLIVEPKHVVPRGVRRRDVFDRHALES